MIATELMAELNRGKLPRVFNFLPLIRAKQFGSIFISKVVLVFRDFSYKFFMVRGDVSR